MARLTKAAGPVESSRGVNRSWDRNGAPCAGRERVYDRGCGTMRM
jgi:hypothetical protein